MPATTSTLAFFAPASASFQPAPYTPSSSQSSSSRPSRSNHRPHDSLTMPPAGMDPQPTDPNVLFIHPPFEAFPGFHLHPDGLTYSLMTENPEWFLDAYDFISEGNSNLKAIPYPPHLEPPRGWCPAKKKDLKDRGSEGWPEGEEPRLRCTFCRRTYAGVNAKSMWRRHVFEKHKIAMANRRDGNPDRPRGRGSGKENKQQVPVKLREEGHDSLVSIVVAPQTLPQNVAHKSRFRPGKSADVPKRCRERDPKSKIEDPNLQPKEDRPVPLPADVESEDNSTARADSPPALLVPSELPVDPSYTFTLYPDRIDEPTLHVPHPVVPESPYNPMKTPSFRHSPPPLPSDQPWRYPSPSHPLHSSTRDMSLTLLTRPLPSPITKGVQLPESSPLKLLVLHSSPASQTTPRRSLYTSFETPGSSTVLGLKSINKPYLTEGRSSSPLTMKPFYGHNAMGSSPISRSSATPKHRRQSSDLSETWFSDNSLDHGSTPLASTTNDLFSIYNSWVDDSQVPPTTPRPRPEPDSPVLRCGSVDLSFGLLEPFSYPVHDVLDKELDADLEEILETPADKENRSDSKRSAIFEEVDSVLVTPPLKKRKKSPDI